MAGDKSVCNFPAIFNFGDSNSDTGGLSAAFGQAPPPHGESYFHHPAGRYCDGRVIIDFIGIYGFLLLPSFYFYFYFYEYHIYIFFLCLSERLVIKWYIV